MGTVGLSFGSPTSGTGFDVATTVASIVANLQKVEQPWKDQLTALEAQDTALSNIGTLFSALSTDMSALTDFTGITTLKEGSSSNTNLLELTSATSSAVPGSYEVQINSLATTAYGYMDPVASVSDTLTGSVTINGTEIDVPAAGSGNDNLQGLANVITSSGAGVTASVLTDANGSRLVLTSKTSGAAGSLTVSSSLMDGSTAVSFNSVLATGSNASLTVNGVDLESASNTVSGLIPGVTFQLLGQTATGSEVQVVIANDTSDTETAISQFVTDYNSLITAINAQEGKDSDGNAEPLFGSPTLSLLQQQLLSGINFQNPNGYLSAVSSASDTLTGSITINGTEVDVPAAGSGSDNLAGLAAAINAAGAGVTANVVNNGGGPQLVLAPMTTGATVTVSSSLTDSATGATLSYTGGDNSISGLTSLGVSMNNDGTIDLDAEALESALNSNFSGVVAFFQNANSWGTTFATMLNQSGDTSSTGILKLAENSNANIESTLNADVSREDALIATQQTRITAELNTANEILQELPAQLQGVDEMYSALSGYNEKSI